MTVTEWRPVPDRPGYEASDDGQVRGPTGKVLSTLVRVNGYLRVTVSRPQGKRADDVHRMVLVAFIGPRPPGMEARHLNGDNRDNRACNLAWGTHSENMYDQVRHGTHAQARKTTCPQGHPLATRGGRRVCQPCNTLQARAYRQRRADRATVNP